MILLARNFQEHAMSLLPYCFHDKLTWKHPRNPKQKMYAVQQLNGAPEEIRTPDPQIRSLVLYPAELRALIPVASKGQRSRRIANVSGFHWQGLRALSCSGGASKRALR